MERNCAFVDVYFEGRSMLFDLLSVSSEAIDSGGIITLGSVRSLREATETPLFSVDSGDSTNDPITLAPSGGWSRLRGGVFGVGVVLGCSIGFGSGGGAGVAVVMSSRYSELSTDMTSLETGEPGR